MSDSPPPPPGPSDHDPQATWSGYPPPEAGYPQYGYAPPKHPSATTAMVLGIVAVAGGLLCYLPLLMAPFAWFTGSKAVRDIDESRGAQTGRGEAMAGKVLGIIGTVLLLLALAVIIGFIVLMLTVDEFHDGFLQGWEES
ncbi:MAG: hypothetical protein JWR55_1641 [Aeromicrobium sp.]|jgi:hypothetical protein|nr:hypothetical protein [Aeromicrobium sp.]